MKSILVLIVAMGSMPAITRAPKEQTPRQKVIAAAASQIGVTEKTGRNDGKQIEAYISSVGLDAKGRYPYCACFVYWVGREALGSENPYPKSAWSPHMVKGGTRITATSPIKGGEAFGIYFSSKKRVAHTGLIERRDGSSLITIEANTSANAAVGSAADRDGQGVYRKRRPWRTVRYSKDWISR